MSWGQLSMISLICSRDRRSGCIAAIDNPSFYPLNGLIRPAWSMSRLNTYVLSFLRQWSKTTWLTQVWISKSFCPFLYWSSEPSSYELKFLQHIHMTTLPLSLWNPIQRPHQSTARWTGVILRTTSCPGTKKRTDSAIRPFFSRQDRFLDIMHGQGGEGEV